MTTKFLGITMGWTSEAMAVAEAVGLRHGEVEADIERIRGASITPAQLLAECLDGADENHAQGWHDYVDAIEAVVDADDARADRRRAIESGATLR